jgi:pSer/pThr/pTyr-binding forkhead associated (FHA) protein
VQTAPPQVVLPTQGYPPAAPPAAYPAGAPAYPPQAYAQPPAYPPAVPAYPAQPAYSPPPAMSGFGLLTVLEGLPPQNHEFPSAEFVIGRFPAPDQGVSIGLDDKSVSRRHLKVRCNLGTREYYIMDLGSSFGTTLLSEGRQEKLTPNVEKRVYNGDIVQVGSAVRVRLQLPAESRNVVTQL